jgi:hypothetical protein
MEFFLPPLPSGQALVAFVICLLIGTFVIIKYSVDQFDKPIIGTEDKDPWRFVGPRYLTSRRQYLTGFSIYCGTLLLIFFAVSIFLGPGTFFFILKAITAALTQTDLPNPAAIKDATLQAYPTFPIVIAFYIVGLNPTLPKALDFELIVRKFAHRMAYIPKNMNRIFNFMRFSEFDLSEDRLNGAYAVIDLRRPAADADDLKFILPVINRTVLLYAQAGTLAGDLDFQIAADLQQRLSLEVFTQYRAEIQNVGVNLQAIDARLFDLGGLSAGDRRRAILTAQRDLVRNLELLYVIFACASTVQDTGRISERLRAIGFASSFPPPDAIPWEPILRAIIPAGIVLFCAYEIAANTWLGSTVHMYIPSDARGILVLLLVILFVHAFAIGQALSARARLIASEQYFSETGKGKVVNYGRIFLRCWVFSVFWYLLLNIRDLGVALLPPPSTGGSEPLAPTDAVVLYVQSYLVWAIVPACCGALTAYTIDRPARTLFERIVSGLLQGTVMGVAAIVAIQLNSSGPASGAFELFSLVIYGGLGFVFGFELPLAARRYWRALEERLPDQINVLRANVLQYFRDIQQFTEWLNTRSGGLEGKRPLDVLAEDGGLKQLITFVGMTRTKIAPAPI